MLTEYMPETVISVIKDTGGLVDVSEPVEGLDHYVHTEVYKYNNKYYRMTVYQLLNGETETDGYVEEVFHVPSWTAKFNVEFLTKAEYKERQERLQGNYDADVELLKEQEPEEVLDEVFNEEVSQSIENVLRLLDKLEPFDFAANNSSARRAAEQYFKGIKYYVDKELS